MTKKGKKPAPRAPANGGRELLLGSIASTHHPRHKLGDKLSLRHCVTLPEVLTSRTGYRPRYRNHKYVRSLASSDSTASSESSACTPIPVRRRPHVAVTNRGANYRCNRACRTGRCTHDKCSNGHGTLVHQRSDTSVLNQRDKYVGYNVHHETDPYHRLHAPGYLPSRHKSSSQPNLSNLDSSSQPNSPSSVTKIALRPSNSTISYHLIYDGKSPNIDDVKLHKTVNSFPRNALREHNKTSNNVPYSTLHKRDETVNNFPCNTLPKRDKPSNDFPTNTLPKRDEKVSNYEYFHFNTLRKNHDLPTKPFNQLLKSGTPNANNQTFNQRNKPDLKHTGSTADVASTNEDDDTCHVRMERVYSSQPNLVTDSGLDTDSETPIYYVTLLNWKGKTESIPNKPEALFGGQLTGRQYNSVKVNPLFLECKTNDDVTLDISTRSLGRDDNSVRIDVNGSKVRRASMTEFGSLEQHDSGVSSDISSGDSQSDGTPVVRAIEKGENGEIVLMLNRNMGTGLQRTRSAKNSVRVQKNFGNDTRMVVSGNNISFVKDIIRDDEVTGQTLERFRKPDPSKMPHVIPNDMSFDDGLDDEEDSDHYQTIDAVIQPEPDGDNNDLSDNSDDIAAIYAQVRKGKTGDVIVPVSPPFRNTVDVTQPSHRDPSDPVPPLYTSTVIVDTPDVNNSMDSNCSMSHDDCDTGTMTRNPRFDPTVDNCDNPKTPATRSMSTDVIESSHKPPLIRAYSEGQTDSLDLPKYWNPNKSGKRRKKDRTIETHRHSQPPPSSPNKELKSILVSSQSNPLVDDSVVPSTTTDTTLQSQLSTSEGKSVKFSEDTVDNEYKAKHYHQEVIDFCPLHRPGIRTPNGHNHDEVQFEGTFSWPAQPRDAFIAENGYHNNNFQDDDGVTESIRRICPKCCQLCKDHYPATNINQTGLTSQATPFRGFSIANGSIESAPTPRHMLCPHGTHPIDCRVCAEDGRKAHLKRRQTIMRWSLMVFLVMVVIGMVIGLAVHFGTKPKT